MNELNWFPNNIIVLNPVDFDEGTCRWRSNMDSPIYPPRSLPLQSSPVRSVPSRGYRRGNTISSYHQPSPRYPAYPRKQSWERTDWDDVHLPNYEDYSDSEFDRPRSPPRGQQCRYSYPQDGYGGYSNYRYGPSQSSQNARGSDSRGEDRRANSRNVPQLSHIPSARSQNYATNKTTNSTDKAKPTAVTADVQRFATKLSNVNKQILFEKYDGKVFNTKEFENNNNNNIDADAPIETIPLLLDTKRRNRTLVIDEVRRPSDLDNRDVVSMEIEDPESPSAAIETHIPTTRTNPNDVDNKQALVPVQNLPQTPALHLPIRVVEQPKPNKVHIQMNVQLTPPETILNTTDNLEQLVNEAAVQLEREDSLKEVDVSLEQDTDTAEDLTKVNEKLNGGGSLKRKDVAVSKKRSSCDSKKHKSGRSAVSENAPPPREMNSEGLRKRKSDHNSKLTDFNDKQAKESKPARIEKRRNYSVKERNKRSEAKNIRSIAETTKGKQDGQTSTVSSNVISVINEVVSNIPDPHMRNLESLIDSLRKYDSYLSPSQELQPLLTSFISETTTAASELQQTLMCDSEIEQITSETTPKPAKIQKRRYATVDALYNRTKSVEGPCSSSATAPPSAKIIKRRRTIVDASDAAKGPTQKTRRSRSRNKYQADPDFKAKVRRATTPVRITRSKSKEILSRSNSMDALVPQTPDDPDFFQQITPPATPRTPHPGDTPDILRTLNMKSVIGMALINNSGLDMPEVTQDIGHVYAPSLFSQNDVTARLDPRLNRPLPIASAALEEDATEVVDVITLQNTLANRVSTSVEKICPNNVRVVLKKLSDKELHQIQKELRGDKRKKLKKDRQRKQDDSNNFPCSIPIASIGIPKLAESGFNGSVVDDILKLMDSAPISTKERIPRICKSIDQLESSAIVPVDNALTKPLSSASVRQTAAIKTFDTFAAVSADSEQTVRAAQPPAKPDPKEKKMRRLFEVEATQIYMPIKKNKIPAGNLLKNKKKKTQAVLKQCFAVVLDCPFADDVVTDFINDVDVRHANILVESEYLHEATTLPIITTHMPEKANQEDDGDTEIMNIDEIFDNQHDVGNLIINGEPPVGISSSSSSSSAATVGEDLKAESKASVTASKAYEMPTIVATIDLFTKEEEEAAAELAQERAAVEIQELVQDSILIVPVAEYAINVTAIIGQYVQMEKLLQRTLDKVKKVTASFTLDIVNCDDSVEDFRKSYSLKLGSKFADYTDSIEIQNFSVTILYTTLTECCLKYNALKIKKLDVATAICDLYNAAGQQHKRSVFCKQLFQLSNHMKEIELAVELERIENQNNSSLNSSIPTTTSTDSAVVVAATTPTLVSTVVTSHNRSLSTSSTVSAHTSIPSPPVNISPVPCSSNSPDSFAPVPQSSPEVGVAAPAVVVHHVPVSQSQHQFSALVSTQNVVRPSDNLASLINTVAQNAPGVQPVNSVAQQVPQPPIESSGMPHTVVLNQGRQTDVSSPQSRRRFKYTEPLQKIMFSAAQINQYNMLCHLYNNSVRNSNRLLHGMKPAIIRTEEHSAVGGSTAPSTISNKVVEVASTYVPQINNSHVAAAAVLRQHPKNHHVNQDTRTLMNFRPDMSKRPPRNQCVPIPSVIPPDCNNRRVAPPPQGPNPRIAVRSIDQLLRQPTNSIAPRDSLTDQVIQTMIAEIDDAATQSCVGNVDKQQTSARIRSISNGEEANHQSDPIARRNLSRDSGNSSGEVGEESRDAADFSCVCGKTADMICSCTLIVYCSAQCQRKDWTRHSADHV